MNLTAWLVVAALCTIAVLFLIRNQGQNKPTRESSPAPAANDPAAAARRLVAFLAPARRTTFDPVVANKESEKPASKFGGRPWLPEGTKWPVCPGCTRPMHLFVQLDVASLPPEAGVKGNGLIQLFMCGTTEAMHDICMRSYDHGAKSVVVRLIDATGPGKNSAAHDDATFPARIVRSWTPHDDFPHYYDLEFAGLAWTPERKADWDDAEAADEFHSPTREGDKLSGWPYWVQNPEYARCKECNTLMNVVLQIDSEDNVPYMFGDAGVGHICQCPQHPHILSWGWACH